MKKIQLISAIILVFAIALFSGCAAKETVSVADSDVAAADELLPTEKRAKEIIDGYEKSFINIFDNYSNAKAAAVISENADEVFSYGDAVLEVILDEMKKQYDEGEYTIHIEEEKAVGSVRAYAERCRNAFDETADSYMDILGYSFNGGTGASAEYSKYRFECAKDYFNKMIELARRINADDNAVLEVLKTADSGNN